MKLIIISKEYYRRLFNTVLMLLEGESTFSKFASLVKLQKESATWATIDTNSTQQHTQLLKKWLAFYVSLQGRIYDLNVTSALCK